MNTCKTCTHWERFIKELDIKDGKFRGPHAGDCTSKSFIYEDEVIPPNGLAYWDHEGYQAYFATGENFGCIHWRQQQ